MTEEGGRKIELNIEKIREMKPYIATPMYGGMCTGLYTKCLMDMTAVFMNHGVQSQIYYLFNESLVTRARNYCVANFLKSDATHLFFIDADIEFNPEDILRMVAYDKPIVVGAYPKKALNWTSIISAARADETETEETIEGHSSNYVVNFDFLEDEKGNKTPQVQIEDNLVKLKDAGTGFMCIRKDVIQQMFDKHPEYKYVNDINVDQKFEPFMYALFDTMIDPESRRYLSEDYMFCRTWQNMGGTVYLDPRTALNHVGHYTFRGNIRKLFTGENNYSRKQEVQSGKTTT